MAKKKVLRYTEEEFITLLENIVKRVKKEQINEARKRAARKRQLSENTRKLDEMGRRSSRRRPNARRK
jgi:hypothetical protein